MTIHQCPKCELRFEWTTELDDHCWHDHPEFRHEYPAQAIAEPVAEPPPLHAPEAEPHHKINADMFLGWLNPLRTPASTRRGEGPNQRRPG
jgi:hypothetical protein